jgi:hypothetical protein
MESWTCILVDNVVLRWLVGILVVSLGVGYLAAWGSLKVLRTSLQLDKGVASPRLGVPSWLIGLTERLFVTVLVGIGYDVAIPIILYIVVKMAIFWKTKYKGLPNVGERAGASLIGTAVSLLLALIGGMVCKGRICI